jgi:hypothetical protein
MRWLGLPMGHQSQMFDQPAGDDAAVAAHRLYQAESAGFNAGKNGTPRGDNSWTPGTMEHQSWDQNWIKGQQSLAESAGPPLTNGKAVRKGWTPERRAAASARWTPEKRAEQARKLSERHAARNGPLAATDGGTEPF